MSALISLCPFALILGSASAVPLVSSGRATAVSAPSADGVPTGSIPVKMAADFSGVSGVPEALPEGAEGAVFPAIVVAAMRELLPKPDYRVFTPAPLVEEGGIKFAPHLIEHVW
jgi:hypothetical protein